MAGICEVCTGQFLSIIPVDDDQGRAYGKTGIFDIWAVFRRIHCSELCAEVNEQSLQGIFIKRLWGGKFSKNTVGQWGQFLIDFRDRMLEKVGL